MTCTAADDGGAGDIKARKAALRKEIAGRLRALDDAYIREQVRCLVGWCRGMSSIARVDRWVGRPIDNGSWSRSPMPIDRSIVGSTHQQSRPLFARLLALPAVAASKCLSVYLSMPSKEVPTYPELLGELCKGVDGGAGGGREVYVPKVGRRVCA